MLLNKSYLSIFGDVMSVRISRLYGMDIYTGDAGYIGKISDIILNIEKGEAVRVTTEPLRTITRSDASRVLKEKSILFKRVTSIGDIMIVGRVPRFEAPPEPAPEPQKRVGLRPSARQLLKR